MLSPDARILVFAKAPVPGHSKTRLIPALGKQGAADLHAKLVIHTLKTATGADLCPVELWCADSMEHPFFLECATRFSISLEQQQGNNLGERMAHAFSETLKHASCALLIGTDCPALTVVDLQHALDRLTQGDDCVLKPAEDGGYVLIGLKQPNQTLFQNIDWGSDRVMRQTRQQLESQEQRWHELETTRDLDRPEDLDRLAGIFNPPSYG
jgi:rSAM/selenodomain-associated transferase 1